MPNTLAHIGLQAPLTKLGLKTAPLQWIAVGCIIPDIPWILQRIFRLLPAIDPVSLRMYAIFQASFFSCCILSMAFALLTRKTRLIFFILSVNCLAHLLLDSLQTKWGNGVNFLIPFSWESTSFALFWPEHSVTYILTAVGFILFFCYWPQAVKSDVFLQKPNKTKTICFICAFVFYLTSPLFFIKTAYNADMHYSKTIRNQWEQAGKVVEIDRGNYNQQTHTISNYAANNLPINNPPRTQTNKVSIKGVFDSKNSITLTDYHEHKGHRDYASYAGLLFTLLLWLYSIMKIRKNNSALQPPCNKRSHEQQ